LPSDCRAMQTDGKSVAAASVSVMATTACRNEIEAVRCCACRRRITMLGIYLRNEILAMIRGAIAVMVE